WAEHPAQAELGLEVEIFQALESISALYRAGVETYNVIQRRAPWAHHLYFGFLEFAQLHARASRISPQARQRFRAKIAEAQPNVVVSTHAHLNHGFFELVREVRPACRVVTYCGEVFGGYGFARGWVNPRADHFIAATEACAEQARWLGMPTKRCHVGGFLLNPAFWEPEPSQEELHRNLCQQAGLPGEQPLIILSTGANSANNHLRLLEAMARERVYAEVIALCGGDAEAQAEIKAWESAQQTLAVAALPRQSSEELRRYMLRAAAIVARPGTGTTSEAILCGTPIIHNGLGGIMPQEWLTVKYLRTFESDRVIGRPVQLPDVLAPLLRSVDDREAARTQMRALCPEGHPRKILEFLRDLAA
ncbi:MAG: UDP-N-acetylglucosamine--LPS N-acetylglucosamine transferase, partial [Opitutales bacterium]